MKKIFSLLFVLFILSFELITTKAWVYPEHRDIVLLAIQNLNPGYRSILDKLWREARIGYEFRLTESVIDATQTTNPTHLDYASFPAIAGDHSTSAQNMLYNILQTNWILDVADITAKLKIDIANSTDRNMRVNALRNSDIRLQTADPDYATRAGHNNVHFLLSLFTPNENSTEYAFECIKEGAELNALAIYVWYHYSALKKMNKIATGNLTQTERSELILAALADEGSKVGQLP